MRAWHLWIIVRKVVALCGQGLWWVEVEDQVFVRVGHLWIRACEVVALVDPGSACKGGGNREPGTFRVWHLWIRVWKKVWNF